MRVVMKPDHFNPVDFERGKKYRMELEVTPEIRIPVLLVRGASPGKTLVATAAVHGDEYEGVQAIFECFDELDPAPMRGDFLAVPVANTPAFLAGTRISPLDDGNLARCFPGAPDAGPTAAIAWYLDQYILARADFYVDLHSGGVGFLMPSMAGYDSTAPRSLEAALVSGSPVIWGHPVIAPGRTVSAAKARRIFQYTHGAVIPRFQHAHHQVGIGEAAGQGHLFHHFDGKAAVFQVEPDDVKGQFPGQFGQPGLRETADHRYLHTLPVAQLA